MGSTNDLMVVPATLFILALGFFLIYFMATTLQTNLLANPIIAADEHAVEAFQTMTTTANRLDYIFFAFFIATFLGVIITSYLIGANPILMFIYMIVIFVSVAITTAFSNIWVNVTESSVFGTTISAFPITSHIITYLPIYAGVLGFVGMFVSFAKPYFQGGGGGEYA